MIRSALEARAEALRSFPKQARELAKAGYKYTSMEEYVLKNGYQAYPSTLTEDEEVVVLMALDMCHRSRFFRKECFCNAQSLVRHGATDLGISYTEGYFWKPRLIMPVQHAWVSINKKVVDLTARLDKPGKGIQGRFRDRPIGTFPEGWEYFGVDIPRGDVVDFFEANLRNDTAYYSSIIEDFYRGAPLMKH